VAPFTVASGEDVDSSLVAGLADWISTAVLSTGLLEVVGPDAVRRLSPVGDERDDTSVINRATHEATQHSRSDIVLIGTIGTRRDSLVWRARLVDPTVSQVLRTVDVVTRADGDPIAGLEMFQDHILGALATVVDHRFSSWAGRSSQPSSYEAYRAFADGFEAYRGREFRRAAASFEVAAGEDGAFTAAVLWAAWAHWNHFQQGMSIHLVRRAPADSILATLQPKRAGMSPWEVALHDHLLATTKYDLQGAYDAVSRMLEHSPDVEWTFRRFHLGKSLDRPNAVLLALEELDSDPQWLGSGEERYWSFKAWAFHRLGRYEDELALARAQWDKDPSNWRGRFYMFRALAGLGRTTEAQAVLAIDLRFPGMMSELHAHGFHQERRARMSEYLSRLEARPVKDRDDEWHYEMGNALGGFDRFGEAAVHLRQIPPDSPRWLDAAGELGWVMAKLGDDEEALRLSAELERIDEAAWRLVLQARIASALGHKDLAVSLLARMSIRGQLHQDLWFPELIGYPPFEEIQRPKG
jgi:tetratricopeptide (TPR) repeat protein